MVCILRLTSSRQTTKCSQIAAPSQRLPRGASLNAPLNLRRAWPLQHHADRDCFAGMHTIVQVISVVIANIDVVGGIPILRPVSWPRVNHHERIAAVLEARITRNYQRQAVDAKPVSRAEMEIETS